MPGADERARQAELVEAIATIVLEEGLDVLALRGLAARLSTSARMLLYYFGNKDALVHAVLECISGRMAVRQQAASLDPRESAGQFLADMLRAGAEPDTAQFLRVWVEVIARAARNEAPYREIAVGTVAGWLDWIGTRLLPSSDNDAKARVILSIVEGVTILEMARPGTTEAARRLLPILLDGAGSSVATERPISSINKESDAVPSGSASTRGKYDPSAGQGKSREEL